MSDDNSPLDPDSESKKVKLTDDNHPVIRTGGFISNMISKMFSLSKSAVVKANTHNVRAHSEHNDAMVDYSESYERLKVREVRHEKLDKIVEVAGQQLDVELDEQIEELARRKEKLAIEREAKEQREDVESEEYASGLERRKHKVDRDRASRKPPPKKKAEQTLDEKIADVEAVYESECEAIDKNGELSDWDKKEKRARAAVKRDRTIEQLKKAAKDKKKNA